MNLNTVDISKLPADVRKQFLQLQVMYAEKKIRNKARENFLSFVKCVWPEFVEGSHHRHEIRGELRSPLLSYPIEVPDTIQTKSAA